MRQLVQRASFPRSWKDNKPTIAWHAIGPVLAQCKLTMDALLHSTAVNRLANVVRPCLESSAVGFFHRHTRPAFLKGLTNPGRPRKPRAFRRAVLTVLPQNSVLGKGGFLRLKGGDVNGLSPEVV